MKKLIGLLLAICLVVGVLTFNVSAYNGTDSGTIGEGVFWQYSQGVLSIMGKSPAEEEEDTNDIYSYNYYEYPWRNYVSYIKTIVLDKNVEVNSQIFTSCRNLESIYYTGGYSGILDVTISGYGVTYSYQYKPTVNFIGPNNEWITIGDKIDTVAPSGVFNVGQRWIFNGDTLKIMGSGPMGGEQTINNIPHDVLNAVKHIDIGYGITIIEDYAFKYMQGVESVQIPDTVTAIGDGAFHGCVNLKSVIIPGSVSRIGSFAFYNCSGLEEVYMSRNMPIIGKYAFSGCNKVSRIEVDDIGELYSSNYTETENSYINEPDLSISTTDYNYRTTTVIPRAENRINIVSATGSQNPEVENSDRNAYDGSLLTRWAAMGQGEIVFDLGSEQYVEKIMTSFWRWDQRAVSYKLFVSSDGVNYERIFDGTSSKGVEFNYVAVKEDIRYIKLIAESVNHNGWMSLNELVAYSK